jgi:hypothetical protein
MEKRQLLLDKCTKTSCKRCDMGYILKDFIKPIMQCLTVDIPDYYMRLLTTKCLNNAVLMSYFMLGKKGIKIANACDSVKVQERHSNKVDNNTTILIKLRKTLLNKQCKYRQLFYILMTDSSFPHDDGMSRHFPGHVFVIEKIPGNPDPIYYFHQAYINQYDYAGHIKRNNNTLELSWDSAKRMIEQIHYILLNPTWDENSVKYWKDITFVNTKNMLGAKSQGKMFLCYRKAQVTDCIDRLEEYTKLKLKQISKLKISKLNETYGSAALYDSDQNPLSVIEMQRSLKKLLLRINKSKMSGNNFLPTK